MPFYSSPVQDSGQTQRVSQGQGRHGVCSSHANHEFARVHSALNGAWTLVHAKSYFAGEPVVQTGTASTMPPFTPAKTYKNKTKWDHDVLKVTTTQSGAITLENYALAADGTMLVTVERAERKPSTLVFQRK
jgi:hypothetical protein